MKKVNILLLIMTVLSQFVYSQISGDDLDNKYTPPESSIFNSDENNDDSAPILTTPRHEINFQPFHLLRSKANLEYRRNFTDVFSMSMGVGYNFANDYFLRPYYDLGYMLDLDETYSLGKLLYNANYISGFNLNPSIRITYDSWYFDNAFIQLDYRYDYYRYEMNSDNDLLLLKTNLYTHSFNLIYGVKGVYGISDKYSFVHTLYYGFGGRLYETYGLKSITSDDPWSGFDETDDYEFTSDPPQKTKAVSFTFILGYSFGLGIK